MGDKKRIGIFSPYLGNPTGGEKYILTIAECLSKIHDVDIFWDEKHDIDFGAKRFNIDLSNVKIVPNIFSPKVSFFTRLRQTSRYNSIIYLSDGSIPTVLCKNLYLHFQFPVEWVKLSINILIKKLRVKKIICNSYFTKNYIDKKFGVNSTVIYPPVDIIHNNKSKKENIILHVGRFASEHNGDDFKKQQFMADIFRTQIDKKLKGWKFIIAGSVSVDQQERFNVFKERMKGSNIKFVVNSSLSDLVELYKKSKIYWHATGYNDDLHSHPEKAEHFGISTVEAMSNGTVPVVISAGGQKEIVTNGDDGYLWNTAEELVEKTLFLINNKEELERLSKNAQLRTQIFNKSRFCNEINTTIQ